MAWCPFAVHKPLSENHTQGKIKPRAVILHTAVSTASSLFDFFQNNSNLESHFYVDKNGRIEQYMDTEIMADANKNANDFAVSIESWDNGAPDKTPWNDPQIVAITALIDWLCDVHPSIPRVQIPSAYGAGIGWHVMFGAPGPWTPVSKSCPGKPRIEQTKNLIIPAVARYDNPPVDLETDLLDIKWNVDMERGRASGTFECGLIAAGGNSALIKDLWIGCKSFWGNIPGLRVTFQKDDGAPIAPIWGPSLDGDLQANKVKRWKPAYGTSAVTFEWDPTKVPAGTQFSPYAVYAK